MITQEHIRQAIDNAEAGISNLTDEILAVRGFSTPTIRRLINNLTNFDCNYLEVGVLCGATFVSSFNKNCTSVGVEDFSQNFQADIPGYDKDELQRNIDKFYNRAKEIYIHYSSCYDVDKSVLPKNIDVYFADYEHGIVNQSKALHFFLDNMADKFAFCIDDTNWDSVRHGTELGFYFLKDKISIEAMWSLGDNLTYDPIWHNGFQIYLINKK
jgi:hypothetical protein